MVTLLRLAACSVPASQFSMVAPRLRTALRFACAVFRGCALRFAPCARHFSPFGPPLLAKLTRGAPCFLGHAAIQPLLPASFPSLGFRFGLFPPQAAAFVRPLQFPLKSYGFPGAETARKRFLLWKMGFSAAKIAPSPPYTPPGTIEVR